MVHLEILLVLEPAEVFVLDLQVCDFVARRLRWVEPLQVVATVGVDSESRSCEQDDAVAACSQLWETARLIDVNLGVAPPFVRLAIRRKAETRSRGFVVVIDGPRTLNLVEYPTTAADSFVEAAGRSAEMFLAVDN